MIVAGKQPSPQWLDIDSAIAHCEAGMGEWRWASDDGEPDVVMACAGDVPTMETLAAVDLLRNYLPTLRIRVVNVVDLLALQTQQQHPHGKSEEDFDALFTRDKPVIFAFHGYPSLIHRLTYQRSNHANFHVHGFNEEGTTTTPFDMTVLNELDRYHLAQAAILHVPGRPIAILNCSTTCSSASRSTIAMCANTVKTCRKCVTGCGRANPAGENRLKRRFMVYSACLSPDSGALVSSSFDFWSGLFYADRNPAGRRERDDRSLYTLNGYHVNPRHRCQLRGCKGWLRGSARNILPLLCVLRFPHSQCAGAGRIEQRQAFNLVDHQHLTELQRAFGFGDKANLVLVIPATVVMLNRQIQRARIAVAAEHRNQHDIGGAGIFKGGSVNHADVDTARFQRDPCQFAFFHAVQQQLFNTVRAGQALI